MADDVTPTEDALREPTRRRQRAALIDFWSVVGLSLAYGGITRLVFAADGVDHVYSVVSWSFLLVLPFCFGALSSWLAHRRGRLTVPWALLVPCAVTTLGLFFSILSELEAVICVVMAAPLLFPLAMAGGGLMYYVLWRRREATAELLSVVLLLPFVLGPIESRFGLPDSVRTVENRIEIAADAETVWRHIVSVAAIDRAELSERWIYRVDFPRPIAATLSHEGVGGIRIATFERGVSFFEVVTEWDPLRRLSFEIHADPEFVPATAFDRHIIVGGRFFDVLDGTYEIEPLSDRSVVLHLTSQHRLSTSFNAYAGLWSAQVMDEIQDSILEVIKNRCER